LQSFSNAERVEKATGMTAVHGWAVFEHLDKDLSSAFVAERYWWNVDKEGKWIDFTPRPEEWPEVLLAEAANDAPKSKAKLTAAEAEIAMQLLKRRFKVKVDCVSWDFFAEGGQECREQARCAGASARAGGCKGQDEGLLVNPGSY